MKNLCFRMNRRLWTAAAMLLMFVVPALAQKITVHGLVIDEQGEELIGATVMEKGTTNGVATDIEGKFEISVAPEATLVVSYVGYSPQEVAVDGRTDITVTMTSDATMLQDVVVIGYGSVKKQDATGSVAVITPDEVDAGIATSAQDLLVGASPGVVVTSTGGSPEGGATIRIRGGASLNASNDPLIVLDGVPLDNDKVNGMANPFAMIAPDNIESMTILKDASATAIYGSRASNGVIIITTKKGRSGRPQVNFSANMTISKDRKRYKVLDGNQYRELITDLYGATQPGVVAMLGDANTDWQDEILRTSVSQEYNLSVGGTVGFLPYRVSGSYTDNNGILKDSKMQRVTAGFNLTPQFFDGLLKVNLNVKGYYIKNRFVDEGCVGGAIGTNPTRPVWSNVASNNPDFPYFFNGLSTDTQNGNDYWAQGQVNPLAQIVDKDNTADIYRTNGNFQVDYALHFLPELHFNLNLGWDVTKSTNNIYTAQNSPTAWSNTDNPGAGQYYMAYELRRNTLLDFYANYKKDFEEIYSNLDLTAGYSWQRFDSHGRNNGTLYTTPGFYIPSTVGGQLMIDPSSESRIGTAINPNVLPWDSGRLQLLSFFGRINYTFKDTYLLTFTLRDDGTSRFSKNNRWGLFPALALGWKINNMDFFEGARETMNEFKMRLGWGQTGQQSVGGFFDYMPTYLQSTQGSYYPNLLTGTYYDAQGNLIGYTLYPKGYNPDLKWETTTTWNIGFDMGWLNNRLTANIDWYLRDSKDLLSTVTVAPGSATTNQMVKNVGSLRNIGLELTLGARVVETDNFRWQTSYNVAWNSNKITKLNDSNDPNYMIQAGTIPGSMGTTATVHKVGLPAYTFALYEQIFDEQGKPISGAYVDQNGDGQINSADLVYKHSRDPKVTMSWNNNFSYKNWDLSFQLRASIGNYVYNGVRAQRCYTAGTYQNVLRNLIASDAYLVSQEWQSSYWLENAGYVRCDNITLGYTWQNLFKDKLRLRLYGAVQNPFVITKYKGIDPEVFDGIDNSPYPRPVSFTVGVIASF